MGKVLLLLLFSSTAYEDCKEKEINFYMPLIGALAGIILHLLYWEKTLLDILLGITVGIVLLLVAVISNGGIGMGDGIMLMVSGIFLGFWENIALFMMALGMISITALFLIVIKRKGKNYRLPFLPFLLAAYLLWLV